jgi:peptidoglycan/LPS O-acetylase OafA/YrhL
VLTLAGSLANFFPGMLVFLAVTASEHGPSRWSRGLDAIASRRVITLGVAAFLFLVATQLPFQTSHVATAAQGPLFGLASGLVLIVFVHGRVPRLFSRVLAPIGLISYGVYLWHWVLLSVIWNYDLPWLRGTDAGAVMTLGRFAMVVALTLPIALLSWLLIERPLLRRTTNWERRSRASAAARRRPDDAADARQAAPAPTPVHASSGS